jgi:hypothetical protein
MQLRWADSVCISGLVRRNGYRFAAYSAPGRAPGDVSLSFRKTVEYRLHKVVTKLGIAGRLELVKLDLG